MAAASRTMPVSLGASSPVTQSKRPHNTRSSVAMKCSAMLPILDLNAKGIDLLRQDKHAEALLAFQAALNCVYTRMSNNASSGPPVETSTGNSNKKWKTRTAASHLRKTRNACEPVNYLSRSVALCNKAVQQESSNLSPSSDFDLYNHAFDFTENAATLTMHASQAHQLLTEYNVEVSAIIIFNIGLVYHELGIVRGDTRMLQKGLKFYRIALAGCCPSAAGSDEGDLGNILDLDLLELAIYNNMGHIYSHLCSIEGITTSRQLLQRKLMSMGRKAFSEDYAVFSMNILLSFAQQIRCASAA